jgi:ATP-binding cassette subfamily B protein
MLSNRLTYDFVLKQEGGLNSEVKERGATLSTGQKQLLSFARALAFDPNILVLDEATSSVDTPTEKMIQRALDNLLQNRTAFIIAHRLSTIEKADKIIVLHGGRVREVGKHQELLAQKGIYHKLYLMQFGQEKVKTAI